MPISVSSVLVIFTLAVRRAILCNLHNQNEGNLVCSHKQTPQLIHVNFDFSRRSSVAHFTNMD